MEKPLDDGSIPIIGDANTVKWILHSDLGKELAIDTDEGRTVQLRIVGLLQDSIFQSELVLSQSNFLALFPRQEGSSNPAAGTFTPHGNFGFRVDNEWSDDTKNVQEHPGGGWGHHMRFYPLRDAYGNLVPNTYLMVMDYNGINYDYNDNMYLISNIKPA